MELSVQPDETALDLLRRANRKPLRTGLAFLDELSGGGAAAERGVGRGDIVELYGPSGCGKSEVLINVVAQSVLPAWLGGEERPVVYFDNDGRLSILRLEQLLKERITSNKTFQMKHATGAMGGTSRDAASSDSLALDAHAETVLVSCLRRLRVVRPASLFELLASIEVLKFEIGHRAAIVAVDSMGSFYWQDKMAQSCGGEALSMQGAVVKALVRLVMERPLTLFAAKTALFGSRRGMQGTEHREYLPQTWQRAVTHRIILRRREKPSRPLHRQPSDKNDLGSSAFSLFNARVSRQNTGGGSCSSVGGVISKGKGVAAGEDRKVFYFIVADDGIHDVPSAATLGGAAEEWVD